MSKKKKFSKIFDKFFEKIYRFCYLKTDSQETAKDLAQEVFLKYWEKIEEVENPQAFLYKVARDLVYDFYRKSKSRQILPLEEALISDCQNLEEKIIRDLEFERIKKAILLLKPEYQDVLIMHYVEGIPLKEIAKILGKKEGTLRVLLFRALKALKEKLSQKNFSV
jgi:RNA polymerase sigma-70 factor (ECF subfamily)